MDQTTRRISGSRHTRRTRHHFDPRRVLTGLPPAAFAFNNEPGGGGGAPGGPPVGAPVGGPVGGPVGAPPAPVPGPNPAPGASPAPTRTFTQAEVDEMMSRRLQRAQGYVGELGFESPEQLTEFVTSQRQAQREALEEQKRYKQLYEQGQETAAQERERLLQENQKLNQRYQSTTIDNALTRAASGAINPEQVVMLTRGRVRTNDDGQLEVLDDAGRIRVGATGARMTPDEYVAEWLEQNPHFARAAGGQGAGGRPAAGGFGGRGAPGGYTDHQGQPFDVARAKVDADYLVANQDVITRMAQDGHIQI